MVEHFTRMTINNQESTIKVLFALLVPKNIEIKKCQLFNMDKHSIRHANTQSMIHVLFTLSLRSIVDQVTNTQPFSP